MTKDDSSELQFSVALDALKLAEKALSSMAGVTDDACEGLAAAILSLIYTGQVPSEDDGVEKLLSWVNLVTAAKAQQSNNCN